MRSVARHISALVLGVSVAAAGCVGGPQTEPPLLPSGEPAGRATGDDGVWRGPPWGGGADASSPPTPPDGGADGGVPLGDPDSDYGAFGGAQEDRGRAVLRPSIWVRWPVPGPRDAGAGGDADAGD